MQQFEGTKGRADLSNFLNYILCLPKKRTVNRESLTKIGTITAGRHNYFTFNPIFAHLF